MKHVKFSKTICGVDFLLNILDFDPSQKHGLTSELQTTDFFQVIFIKRAKGTLQLNDKTIDLKDNSVVFISQHQRHQWKVDLDSFDAKVLVFQEDFLNEFFADKYFTYRLLYFYQSAYELFLPIDTKELQRYTSDLEEIQAELLEPKNDSTHLIRSLLYYILIRLNRSYSEYNKITCAVSIDNLAYKFRKLVEENYITKQRLEEYTELLNISRVALNTAVKAQFNITASDFIKSKIIYEAKMKLIYSNLTVSEIARQLNFSEPNHLSRLFKNKEGVSPNEYRATYQNGRN
ncbi:MULTISPECIES: helix-turn-helix domain-containing protein [Flammeovirga]|uniref:Helix-turn-helix domain-containing protein n=1 Tax=Flammeovirga agarivorans TaxID=2726742 RepID=A0A7X8XVY6_9BACT|nr:MULTISPECIES: AraC family transcriptional regulator [Flammeovirga]NLR91788.1 helix-turn-helix domain-containing protein [Flammeovirga agarivorans]